MKTWIWTRGKTLKHALQAYKRRLKIKDLIGARDIWDQVKYQCPYAMGQFNNRP